ncbi:hypothetical protein GGF47_002027 [Coemansia sp. RSA 2524]|nr:hypothetical protein GGF47_002027 [Coemansia sp. RSA 2524]
MPTSIQSFLSRIPELRDADQRAFLYSDLDQQRIDNPEGYQEALKFWTQLLLSACQHGLLSAAPRTPQPRLNTTLASSDEDDEDEDDVLDRTQSDDSEHTEAASVLCFERAGLAARLAFRGDTPTGVDGIVDEMERSGIVVEACDYLAGSTVRRWAGRFVRHVPVVGRQMAVLAWRAQTSQITLDSSLVVRSLVEAAASRVADAHYARAACALTDNLLSMDVFREQYAQPVLTTNGKLSLEDARLVLRCLEDQRQATSTIIDATDTQVLIKFAARRAQRVQPVTEADRGAFHVVSTRDTIARQVTALESRVLELDLKARNAVVRKLRTQALGYLRLKRHVESDVLARRQQALDNIERIVLKLQQAASDVQLLQAFKSGTCALKGLNQEAEDMHAERVFDDWADQALRADEIQAVMDDGAAVVADGMQDVDDDALEAELEALLAADEQKEAAASDKQKESNVAVPGKQETADEDMLANAFNKVTLSPDHTPSEPNAAEAKQERIAMLE